MDPARAPLSARRLAWALVGLAFLSKVSFSFTGVVPPSLGYLVFQGGIHPYLNVLLNLALGAALVVTLQRHRAWPRLSAFHPVYVTFTLGALAILWVQHAMQLLTGIEANAPLVAITMCTTSFLVVVFGLLIPQLLDGEAFLKGVANLCAAICAFSLLCYFAGLPALWKGARFVGVLKHIPYMVTCGSAGFLFQFSHWDLSAPARRKLRFALTQLVFLYCLWLTGTRSALLAALVGVSVFFLAFRTSNQAFRMARVLGVWLIFVASLLFGTSAVQFARDVATGKAALGQRAAQDGVSDRMEEITRGLQMLEKSPHFGLGLLSKFNNADSEDVVDSYNSFQDPHNLFISSAVVAGWPFGIWVIFGVLALGLGSVRVILQRQSPGLVFGLYLLSHLPILSIYHMHLSLGGLADRLYWLTWGFLGLKLIQRPSVKSTSSDH